MCLACMRGNWNGGPQRAHDDEAHVLLHCPALHLERLVPLWGLRRFFSIGNPDVSVSSDPESGPAGLMPLFRAILYSPSGRVDVFHAFRLGKFLEKAWRFRAGC